MIKWEEGEHRACADLPGSFRTLSADSYFWKMGTEAFSSLLTMCWGTEGQAKTEGAWDRHNDPFSINSFRMGLAALTVTY